MRSDRKAVNGQQPQPRELLSTICRRPEQFPSQLPQKRQSKVSKDRADLLCAGIIECAPAKSSA